MPPIESLVIAAGLNPTRVRLDLAGGDVIYLDIRVRPNHEVELGVASPTRVSLVQVEPLSSARETLSPFDDPNFSQRLIEHMHRASCKAIAESVVGSFDRNPRAGVTHA